MAEKLKVDYPNRFIEKPADILIANILSGPLVQLAPQLTRLIKPGGVIVLSGILQEQVDQIIKTYQGAFTLCEPTVRDGWVRIEGLRCS